MTGTQKFMMWTQQPQRNEVTGMAFARAEINDGDAAVAKQRGGGLVHRALRGHSALGVQAGEWRTQPGSADKKRDAPSHPPLFLWRIDAHISPSTDL